MTGLPSPSTLLGVPGFDAWFEGQSEAFGKSMDWFYSPARFLGLSLPTGCHAKGQGVLMYDGLIKKVEDVIVGDLLMGQDGHCRCVQRLCRGRESLYDVIPVKGSAFRVNAHHILTVKITKGISTTNMGKAGKKWLTNGRMGGMVDGDVLDICVLDYLEKSKYFKHIAKLFRVGADFAVGEELPVSPYVLGVLLGDGTLGGGARNIELTTAVWIPEVVSEARGLGDRISVGLSSSSDVTLHIRINGPGGGQVSGLRRRIADLDLLGTRSHNKFIPQRYKVASLESRLELLAGLIDTDGSLSKNSYDFISKSARLADDFAFVCRSVGLAAYVRCCRKGCQTGAFGTYFRVSVSGDCSIIPSRLKKALPRRQKKSVVVTGFSVKRWGYGDYYGFELDGDGRYLLDDFTVTHNSGKSAISMLVAKMSGARTCILTATKGLQDQLMNDFSSIASVVKGQNNFRCTLVPPLRADEGPCHEGMSCSYSRSGGCPYREQLKRALDAQIVITNYAYYLAQTRYSSGLGEFDLLIADESHMAFGALENFLTVSLYHMDVESLGLHFPTMPAIPSTETKQSTKGKEASKPDDSASDIPPVPDLWALWQSWAGLGVPMVQERVEELDQEIRELRESSSAVPSALSHAYRSSKSVLAKLTSLSTATGNWVIQRTQHGYLFTPRWMKDNGDALFQKVPKIMLMSAILSHKTADSIGVPSGDARSWLEVGSYFPPANTPIWHIPTARINYRTDDYGTTIWLARMDQIIQRRLDRKGIVFTVSYDRARLLLSRSRFKDIMFTHSTGDVVQVVNKFKVTPAPAVLVSPTVTTGWDFPGLDYIIVGKVPYGDTKDPVLQARHEDDKEWSAYLAMDTLVQECGRGTRSSTDKCEVLVIDDNFWQWWWHAYKKFAPKWFQERVRGSLPSVPDPLV